MTRWILVPAFSPDPEAVDRWLAAVNKLEEASPQVILSDAGRHLPGSNGCGQATWDLVTAEESLEDVREVADLLRPGRPLLACDWAGLQTVRAHVDPDRKPGIKRTLLLRVRPGTPVPLVEEFEAALAAMPAHITTIGSWSLSRIDPDRSNTSWTHAWEQEFADIDGLYGEYLHHPYHWTGVERWFNPEVPGSIADTDHAHLFRSITRHVLPEPAGAVVRPPSTNAELI